MSDSDNDNIPGNRALRFIGSLLAPMKASTEEQKQLKEVAECLMFAQTFRHADRAHTLLLGGSAIGICATLEFGVKYAADRLIVAGSTKPLGQFKAVRWANNIIQVGVAAWMFNSLQRSEAMANNARNFCRLMDTKARHLEEYREGEPASTFTVARPFSAVATKDMVKTTVSIKELLVSECTEYMKTEMWTLPKVYGMRTVTNRWFDHPQLGKVIDSALKKED